MNDEEIGHGSQFGGRRCVLRLMGAILVFAIHGGFAFLEVGTVRHKNQINTLVKILVDFAISTISYFFIGFAVAYGVTFFVNAAILSGVKGGETFLPQGFTLVKFFFLFRERLFVVPGKAQDR